MSEADIADVCDTLEIFISLKHQNSIIWAWMELKKALRKASSRDHSKQSRSRSMKSHSISSHAKRGHQKFAPPNLSNSLHSASRERPVTHHIPTESQQNITITNGTRYGYPVRDTSLTNLNQDRRATFGRVATSTVTPRPTTHQPEKVTDRRNYYPEHVKFRQQFTPTSRRAQHRPSITHNITGRTSYWHPRVEEYGEEQIDSDEFEDIMLDRITKIEENVNRIMLEKRQKQAERGYVGAPITPPAYLQKLNPNMSQKLIQVRANNNNFNTTMQESLKSSFKDSSSLGYYGNKASLDASREWSTFNHKKLDKIAQMSQKNERGGSKKNVESENSRKVAPEQVISNLKYIPTSKQPLATLKKIRQMVHQNALNIKKSPKNIVHQFLKQDESSKYLEKRKFSSNHQVSSPEHAEEDHQPEQKAERDLEDQENNQNLPLTGNTKSHSKNTIHYVPLHVQMRTTVQTSKLKKYARNPANIPIKARDPKRSNLSFESSVIPGVSKLSNSSCSDRSYQTAKLNNLSSFY